MTATVPTRSARPLAEPTPVLELEGVRRGWRGTPRPVLDHVDLALRPGRVTRLEGVNGCGKTTLLRIAAGVLDAQAGVVSCGGLDPVQDRVDYQRRVGYMSAGDRGLYPRLSPRSHLQLAAALALLERRRRRAAVQEAIERFGIGPFADRRADRLSTGQRQRVRLAMATLHDPRALLLDEPCTALDEDGLAALSAAIRRVTAGGGAVLWTCPAGSGARLWQDEALLLVDGEVVEA